MIMLLEVLCVVLAGWAAYQSMYRPPQYNWKESFRLSLSHQVSSQKDIYAPDFGMSWSSFDPELLQTRLRARLAHLIAFSFPEAKSPWTRRFSQDLAEYVSISIHTKELRAESIAEQISTSKERILFVCEGSQAQEVLALLLQHPGMRDIVHALVFVDPVFDASWLEKNFGHDELDVEANAPIPYIFCFSQGEGSIPEPKPSVMGWNSIRCIDLGDLADQKDTHADSAMAVLLWRLYS